MTCGRTARSKLLEPDAWLETVGRERAAGRTLVFTNGCFELLHAGHLRLLESAAELGDVLICAINRDPSVRKQKGHGRPVLPFSERAALVAGLEAVDYVLGFDEPTPLELIRAIQPDVLVKGADWPLDQIVGREIVERRGGRVVRVPLLRGRSTTDLIDRLGSGLRPRTGGGTAVPGHGTAG